MTPSKVEGYDDNCPSIQSRIMKLNFFQSRLEAIKYRIERWMEQIISMDFLEEKKKQKKNNDRLQEENSDVSSYVTVEMKCLEFLILCTEI